MKALITLCIIVTFCLCNRQNIFLENTKHNEPIEGCAAYMLVKWAIISSGFQAMPCMFGTKPLSEATEFLLIGPLETNFKFSKIQITNTQIFIQENIFEYVVCKMPAILLKA